MIFSNILSKVYISKPTPLNWIRFSSTYLGNLQPLAGAVESYKRLGRGPASGKGKTAGRGQKGQKARGKVPRWFEGGQTPFYKRFPIIGFKRPHRRIYKELNLERIQEFWNNGRIPLQQGETLTIKVMKECGLITGATKDGVKILGNGKEEYTVPLNIQASKASLGAIASIEKLGNSYESKFFSKLGLKAHIYPEAFYLKSGRLPLEARPTHRRDINYYSNPEKNGYLLKQPEILLNFRNQNHTTTKRADRKNHISQQLENASNKKYNDFPESTVIKLSDL